MTPFMKRMSLNRYGNICVLPVRRSRRSHIPLMNAMPVAPWKLYTEAGSASGDSRGPPVMCEGTPKKSLVAGIGSTWPMPGPPAAADIGPSTPEPTTAPNAAAPTVVPRNDRLDHTCAGGCGRPLGTLGATGLVG